MSHECQRFLGIVDEFGSLTQGLGIELGIWHVGTDEVYLTGFPVDLLDLSVLGEVEHHRTGTASTGDIEGPADGPRHILSMADLV